MVVVSSMLMVTVEASSWRRFMPRAAAALTTAGASPTVMRTVSKKAASPTPRPSFLAPAGGDRG